MKMHATLLQSQEASLLLAERQTLLTENQRLSTAIEHYQHIFNLASNPKPIQQLLEQKAALLRLLDANRPQHHKLSKAQIQQIIQQVEDINQQLIALKGPDSELADAVLHRAKLLYALQSTDIHFTQAELSQFREQVTKYQEIITHYLDSAKSAHAEYQSQIQTNTQRIQVIDKLLANATTVNTSRTALAIKNSGEAHDNSPDLNPAN